MAQEAARVLLAEDDLFVAELVAVELERAGMRLVGRVSDGAAAVAETLRLRPDVVLLDVQMPVLDGIGAAAEIQQKCPTPVVLLTVHFEPEIVERAAAAGVGAYLVKPTTAPELQRAIAIARARFRDLEELRRLNRELSDALAAVKVLKGLIPSCSWCKCIRVADGSWVRVERFIEAHTDAQFTHSICPSCAARASAEGPGGPWRPHATRTTGARAAAARRRRAAAASRRSSHAPTRSGAAAAAGRACRGPAARPSPARA